MMGMGGVPWWKRYVYRVIGAEISAITRYYDMVVQAGVVEPDSGTLMETVECTEKRIADSIDDVGSALPRDRRSAVLLNGTLNHHMDVQDLFARLRKDMPRTARVIVVAFNPYLQWLYALGHRLGLISGPLPRTFVTMVDLDNFCRVSGFERVRVRPAVFVPWKLLGLGSLVNAILPIIPLVRHLALTNVIVLRPVVTRAAERPKLTVVIPARNERGNIEAALTRMPQLDAALEVIFVEGHSSDGTWEEIERVAAAYSGRFDVRAFRQEGRGKADAVRLGFSHATGDLLTILDADLTMPPELLPRFLAAYLDGAADFINGSRSVYPMEGEAMRLLNRLGNVFFAKALTAVLGVRIGDALCGTKLMRRDDYERMCAWRRDFGDFDPFGDFELLFPAAELAFGIVDVPVRYRARTYGATNIRRFSDGLLLLRMTLIGLFRIRLGQTALRHGR